VLRGVASLVVIVCGATTIALMTLRLVRQGRTAFRRVRGFLLVGVASIPLGMVLPGVSLNRTPALLVFLVCVLAIAVGLLLDLYDGGVAG
jgi:uncharacterized membrane protein YfcA